MAYVTSEQAFAHLSLTEDMAALDAAMIGRKLAAAQNHVERLLGYRLAARFLDPDEEPGDEDTREEFPASLAEGILQLMAWWFENREAAGPAAREVPFGVREILNEYRDWSF
ncbi:head-tail connector protein [Szabonella alba]|uniref:Phage gp6-like head-tail connector protein n=1 Tax=Szabonella alba TaxID=2804194 RepID=A0A8K0VG11_9RHOB|nr:head-tail connector protein [Szabonella alba]MBL4918974.1 phage gp6-like head-tail connector protein [Szabonella alba]